MLEVLSKRQADTQLEGGQVSTPASEQSLSSLVVFG